MKRLLIALASLAALLVAAAGALVYFFDANALRPRLQAELTKALGRDVQVGDIKLSLATGSVQAAELSVADDPAYSKTAFLRARLLKVGVELKPLIFDRKINVTGLTIEQPDVDLVQSPNGAWNFSTLGSHQAEPKPAAPPTDKAKLDLVVRSIKINDGRVTVKSEGKTRVFEKVNIEVREFSPSSAIPFTLATVTGGTQIKLDGRVGPLDPADTAMTPVESKISISNLDLSDSGFFPKSSGIDGLAALDGTVTSNGRSVETKGRLRADRLKLARQGSPCRRSVEFDFAVHHDVKSKSGTLSQGAIHIGKAEASLTGTYSARSETPAIDMKLSGPRMAVAELVEMLPPLAVVLPQGSKLEGGITATKLSINGPVDRLAIEGPIALHDTRLAGFDLGSNIKKIARIAGVAVGPDTDIQAFSAHIRRSLDGTRVDDLSFVAPAIGELTGSGSVGPNNELDFTMNVRLHTSGMLMTALGQKGDTVVPFFIRGNAANPSFVPDVKAIATDKATAVLKDERVKKALDQTEVGKAARGLLEGLLGGKKQEAAEPKKQ